MDTGPGRRSLPVSYIIDEALYLCARFESRGNKIPPEEIETVQYKMERALWKSVGDVNRVNRMGTFFKMQSQVRQTIGERALRDKFKVADKDFGPSIMAIFFTQEDAEDLRNVTELSRLLDFPLGSYTLLEMTELVLRADKYLRTGRGENRIRVAYLSKRIFDLLRQKSVANAMKIRRSRREKSESQISSEMTSLIEQREGNKDLPAALAEISSKVSKAWRTLKFQSVHPAWRELKKIMIEDIPSAESEMEDAFNRNDNKQFEELAAKTESLRKRSEFLWFVFIQTVSDDTNALVSSEKEILNLVKSLKNLAKPRQSPKRRNNADGKRDILPGDKPRRTRSTTRPDEQTPATQEARQAEPAN
jgi:hypothetical protein